MEFNDLDKIPEDLPQGVPIDNNSLNGEEYHARYVSGLYKNWFLEYASYVILERAVPHLYDGLKPVQRRILHSMKRLDDGRYNKVANIIGHTMQFHPHGDVSIGDALVQLGQKNILIDTQGNWGNIHTGDDAAAPRYIEARLSKFANEVVFNPKTTEWKSSYDGRNKEPVWLPVKFPLLLAQGVEGIAVGLASKILPHNFIELIDASIAVLKGEDFELYPDFPTGGAIDVSKYNNGLRGGKVRVRAKISILDKKCLVITEIPFGTNTTSIIESILNANDKGKIKIKKIDDNTAANVEILIQLIPGTSPDITMDALFAFTDCEISISPNSCVIDDEKPKFLAVKEILKLSTQNTLTLLEKELIIRKQELEDDWHQSSLEKIFIENKIYQSIENCETWESIIETIEKGLDPFKKYIKREVVYDDIVRLTDLKIKRISKFDGFQADEHIRAIEEEIKQIEHDISNIIPYTIKYFKRIKDKFSKGHERKTEIRSFETIQATMVVANNEKLYINREEGFIGTGLRKDEFISDCSDIDDVIVFLRDGKYVITKVQDKAFIGKDIIHAAVFRKNDDRTIYNAVYRDGETGFALIKRFAVTGITRDKIYDITQGKANSKVLYFSANPNGEAEILKVVLKHRPRLKNLILELDFSTLAIKGRGSIGNILTRFPIHKIVLQEKGTSTLGGLKIWFDHEVLRLNTDSRGQYLGEFYEEDKILVLTRAGLYKLYSYDLTNHFDDDIMLIEKFDPDKIFSAAYFDGEIGYLYLKRFLVEEIDKNVSFIGESSDSKLWALSHDIFPQLEVTFGGKHSKRGKEIIDVEAFIGVKSYKAKGKKISTFEIKDVIFIEPLQKAELTDDENGPEDVLNIADADLDQPSLFETPEE